MKKVMNYLLRVLCRFRTILRNLWQKTAQLTERRHKMSDVAGSFLRRDDN